MSSQVTLPENLTIHHINDHFSELKQSVMSENENLVFDAGQIDSIDTSGLQMLLTLVENLKSRQVPFNWQNVNSTLKDNALNIGLVTQLQLQ
ncbi:MAG: STAS domain-containing protein [Thiomicrospira sp.]|uniref:STAS domain-containing protein n=1 Tax=Thiomicrospira sp. TaxID=935 RepID=UPI001A0571EA|nr:STAS domain-containing protein [Thiomicrospira sp.]MBE0494452.1 STAS domain-containing protein [Thiomicrospira sp.]